MSTVGTDGAAPEQRGALVSLLRASTGSVSQRITRALEVLVEELHMDSAIASEFRDGQSVVTHSACAPGAVDIPVGTTHCVEESLCHLTATGVLGTLVPDCQADPFLAEHPLVLAHAQGSYAGVPLTVRGKVIGAVCCLSQSPSPTLNERDSTTVHAIGAFIGELLAGPSRRALDLGSVAGAVEAGEDLAGLTRPLLELMQQVTGLESTYLTLVDWAGDTQRVVLALNSGDLQVPERTEVPWANTLCRRALEEDRPFTNDVPGVWGDCEAARDMGLQTYISVPVLDADDAVVGTLCGASGSSVDVGASDLTSMRMFARLVSGQLARDAAHAAEVSRSTALSERTAALGELARRDGLTGLLNRSGIEAWLATAIESLDPQVEQLAVAFLDLDSFKAVNDSAGHAAGDAVLCAFARSIAATGRQGDMQGRLGGDEFVVAAMLPVNPASLGGWIGRLRRAAVAQVGDLRVSASVGVVTVVDPTVAPAVALELADQAMYAVKAGRKAAV